jgi:hypothetical protein
MHTDVLSSTDELISLLSIFMALLLWKFDVFKMGAKLGTLPLIYVYT